MTDGIEFFTNPAKCFFRSQIVRDVDVRRQCPLFRGSEICNEYLHFPSRQTHQVTHQW
jgi:hypothetical protein